MRYAKILFMNDEEKVLRDLMQKRIDELNAIINSANDRGTIYDAVSDRFALQEIIRQIDAGTILN